MLTKEDRDLIDTHVCSAIATGVNTLAEIIAILHGTLDADLLKRHPAGRYSSIVYERIADASLRRLKRRGVVMFDRTEWRWTHCI